MCGYELRNSRPPTANWRLFSYSVSHDLRAPLRAIDGFAHVVEEDYGKVLDAVGSQYLRRIRAASNRMANLIDDLLELARLTRQTLRKETIDLSNLTLQIIDDLRAEDPSRSVEVEVTPGLVAQADRILMQVVLENLLRNAWKFWRTNHWRRFASSPNAAMKSWPIASPTMGSVLT